MTIADSSIMQARDLTRRYRRGAETVHALDDVSLSLYPGELTVAAGPSGSGKTTLLSVLAGTDHPDEGRVTVADPLPTDVSHDRLPWDQLAFVPQGLALMDEFTVAENVALAAMFTRTADTDPETPVAQVLPVLQELEIDHLAPRYPSQTSGGEQQRTALARALALRPWVVLADEPTGHQDRERVSLVREVLRAHARRGAAVVLTSHDTEVTAAADRLVTVTDGRIADAHRPQATSR